MLISNIGYKIVSTGLLKPLDAEWQKCHEGLERDCKRVRVLAQATEAEMQRQRDLKNGQLRQSKYASHHLSTCTNDALEEERKHVVEWLKAGEDDTTFDVRVDLRKHMEFHHANTGEWLYENPTFKKWLDEDSNTTLWYHASPGSGKTVLASTLISHLQAQGFKVAYFFYSFNDPTRRKSITAIRSLALQILTQTAQIPDQVMKLYEADVANHVFTLRDPQTAVSVLQAFLKLTDRIYIILDGLDECHDGPLVRSSLCRLISTHTYGIVKWFLTSRDENEIRIMAHQLDAAEIKPSPGVVISDIKKYLEENTTRDDLPKCCVESWADASEGNFLWINLMLNIMVGMDLTCEEEIDEELEKFPVGLTGCYLRSLEQLLLRSKQQQELARRIFTLLVVAEQPLHLSELSNGLGVREGAENHSAKRVPKLALIEDLCSHLVIFDRTSRGNEKDPLLKLAHKSVQDFFNLNPDSLDIPIPVGLRQFFVDQEAANLEVGRACLTYLNYTRYLKPMDDLKILDEGDHAFLRYAATFWFWHLMRTHHSHDLFTSVEQLIRSPNFWTCLIVQCKAAPHLFAQLVEVHGGQYRLGAGRVLGQDTPSEQRLNFAFPLPEWLDEYEPSGPIIVQEFFRFIKEWHSVLTSTPLALSQCLRDFTGSTYPCRNPSQSKDIRVLGLLQSDAMQDSSKAFLRSLRVEGDNLHATLTEHEHCSQSNLKIRQVCVDNAFVISGGISRKTIREQIFTANSSPCDVRIHIEDSNGKLTIWTLELSGLNLTLDNGSQTTTFEATGEIQKLNLSSQYDPTVLWVMASRSPVRSSSMVLGFHCLKTPHGKQNEDDSGYGTSGPNSESEDGSDDESDEKDLALNHHGLVLASGVFSPIWFQWQSDARIEVQVEFATHPTEPIAVWSHSAFELQIADLRTGNVRSVILPEPVDIQIRSASALRKGKFHD
jgi:hypothetical protein